MKFLTISLVFFFSLFLQNTAFAIIHKDADNALSVSKITDSGFSTASSKVKKPNFMQKLALTRFAQKLDTTKVYQKTASDTQGDKLAHIGLASSLGGIASFVLLLLLGIMGGVIAEGFIFGILFFLGIITLLTGLIISIIALASNDLTPKGKRKAQWGVGLVGIFVLLFVLFIAYLNTLGD